MRQRTFQVHSDLEYNDINDMTRPAGEITYDLRRRLWGNRSWPSPALPHCAEVDISIESKCIEHQCTYNREEDEVGVVFVFVDLGNEVRMTGCDLLGRDLHEVVRYVRGVGVMLAVRRGKSRQSAIRVLHIGLVAPSRKYSHICAYDFQELGLEVLTLDDVDDGRVDIESELLTSEGSALRAITLDRCASHCQFGHSGPDREAECVKYRLCGE